jgi:hypothetical protein
MVEVGGTADIGTAAAGTDAAGTDALPIGATLAEAANGLVLAGVDSPAKPLVGEVDSVPGAIWMLGPVTPPVGVLLNMVVVVVSGMAGTICVGEVFGMVAEPADPSLLAAPVPAGAGFAPAAGDGAPTLTADPPPA